MWAFVGLTTSNIKDIVLKIIEFMGNNIDSILNISLLISCVILYINIPKVITILMEKKENKKKKIEKGKKIFKLLFWFLFVIIFSFFYFDYLYPELFPLNTTSYVTKRTLKFILAIILNLSNLYINLKTIGFKSWRTLLSLFSLFSTLFFISIFYNEDLRELFKQAVWKIVQTGITIKVLWDIYILQKHYLDILGENTKIPSFLKRSDKENVMLVKSSSEQKNLSNKSCKERNSKVKTQYLNDNNKIEKKKEDIFNNRKLQIKEKKQLIIDSKKKQLYSKLPIEKIKEIEILKKKKMNLDSWLEYKERNKVKKRLNEEKKWLFNHTREGLRKQRLKEKALSFIPNKNLDYDEFDPLWNKLTDWKDVPEKKKEDIIDPELKNTELITPERKSVKWEKDLENEIPRFQPVGNEKNLTKSILVSESKENGEDIEWVKSKDERKKYTDDLLKKRKVSKVKYFINEKGQKVYFRKYHRSSYMNHGKCKLLPLNTNVVSMEYPRSLADKGAIRKILSSSSPSKIQIKMYEKQNVLTVLPKIPEYSELNNVIEYIPTLEKAKERELILIRLILLRVTYFEEDYVAGNLLSQLIEVQSKIADIEKKALNLDENIEKKSKKFKLKLFNFKIAKVEEVEQEFAYLKHPSVSVLTSAEELEKWKDDSTKKKKSIFKKGVSLLKNIKGSTPNDTNTVVKPNRPLLPETIKHNSSDINPPKLILTPHEELYKLYYGERKFRDYELPAKHIIMETDVTVNYRNKQYKDWLINLEGWAARHPEALTSVAGHSDLKEIVSKHEDYTWLHKNYLREYLERAKEIKKNQLEMKIKKNKALPLIEKTKLLENAKVNKDLPPLPVLEEKNNRNIEEASDIERWRLFEEMLVRWGKEAEESKNWKKSTTPFRLSSSELDESVKDLPILPFKRDSKIEGTDNVLEDTIEEVVVGKEEFQEENKESVEKDKETKPIKSIEEMTADELEVFLAPEIKRRQEMSDYWRKGIEDICGKIPDEDKKYGDKWDEVTPHILKLKRWQEYYERNAYRLKADYYNPDRFPDPVEDPESTVPSECGSDTESIDDTEDEGDTNSLNPNNSDKGSIQSSKNKNIENSIKDKKEVENSEFINVKKELDNIETSEPELVIEYTPNYYHWKEIMGEDALLVRQIEAKCREKAVKKVEAAKAALKIIEDKKIAEQTAKEKVRQDLIDNGIDPDNPNELWVNGKAIETVCIAILDRAIGGLDYKINKIDWEREWRENAHILYLDLAMAWDITFNGGSYEEKLGPEFYENVEKRREIWRKRVEITELKNIFISWRDRLKITQAKSIFGSHYTDRQWSDLDDERIFWLQEIVDNPKRQTEVLKYIQDYVNRINAKKVRKEHLTHEQVIQFVEVYLTEQKPGLLNLKPFKEMKPDFMTLRYVDYFLQFKENERNRWAEQKIQAKKDAELKAAQLAAERAKKTPEDIRAEKLAEDEYWEKEKEWIIQKEAEIAQLKKEVAEYHLEQEKKREKSW